MTRVRTIALVLAALLCPQIASASEGLLDRMAALNPGLHTYTAKLHAHVTLKTFPFLGADLTGTVYHKEPASTKVVIESGLPPFASKFDQLMAHMPGPSQWNDIYEVTLVSDEGGQATFHLVPRKPGNVTRIDAVVDDADATIHSLRWTYANGGYAEVTNHYGNIRGSLLVVSQEGHVEEPGYTADIASTLDNYRLNVPIADATFTQ